MDISSWQSLLEQHHTKLNQHLETLTLMRQHSGNSSSGAQMLQSCIDQTESLVQNFKISAYTFMGELQSNTQSQPTKSAQASPVTGGIVGPTPAEQVLQNGPPRRTVIRTKRKAPGQDPMPPSVPVTAPAKQPPRKRARPATGSRSGTSTPRLRDPTSTSTSQLPQPAQEEDEDGDDSYLRAVETKLKEKEAKMWKGMVKKRKRSSDMSDTVFEQATTTPDPTPKTRKKSRQTFTQIAGDVVIEHTYTPQQEKQPNKRSSPAAEYMENILRRADAKRQRATRSNGISVG